MPAPRTGPSSASCAERCQRIAATTSPRASASCTARKNTSVTHAHPHRRPSAARAGAATSLGPRDKPSIQAAVAGVKRAEANLSNARDLETSAQQRVEHEQRAVDHWTTAMRDTANQQAQLTAAVTDFTDALDHTRPQRSQPLLSSEQRTLEDPRPTTIHPRPSTLGAESPKNRSARQWRRTWEQLEARRPRNKSPAPQRPCDPRPCRTTRPDLGLRSVADPARWRPILDRCPTTGSPTTSRRRSTTD